MKSNGLNFAVTIWAIFAVLFLPSWASAEESKSQDYAPPKTHEPQEEWRGLIGGPENASTFVARNMEDWQKLWAMISAKPPVTFDPTSDIAVGIFLGTRHTRNYSMKIISAEEEDGVFVVEYMQDEPGKNLVIQALTTPYLIQLLPKTDLKVDFRVIHKTQLIVRLREEQTRRKALESTLKGKQLELKQVTGRIWELEQKILRCEQHNRELQERFRRIRGSLPPGGFLP